MTIPTAAEIEAIRERRATVPKFDHDLFIDQRDAKTAHVTYLDGDGCAEVWGNIGLDDGYTKEDVATFIAHAPDDIDSLFAALDAVTAERDRNRLEIREWVAAARLVDDDDPVGFARLAELRTGYSGVDTPPAIVDGLLADVKRLTAERDRMKAALSRIAKWFGEFPETGRTWSNTDPTPMSYGACFGSNGERDFMRKIASDAIEGGRESQRELTERRISQ